MIWKFTTNALRSASVPWPPPRVIRIHGRMQCAPTARHAALRYADNSEFLEIHNSLGGVSSSGCLLSSPDQIYPVDC
jgi:hypothetical protein